MREILHRGKRINNSELVEGCLIFNKTKSAYHILECFTYKDNTIENMLLHEVFGSSVSQYTGLTDKTKTKIFEHDICTFDDINYWEVVFKDFSWQLVINQCFHRLEYADSSRIKVVGNIFNDSDLLKIR